MSTATEPTILGLINSETPAGRVFEFDEGATVGKLEIPPKLEYYGLEDIDGIERVSFLTLDTDDDKSWPDMADADPGQQIALDEWNEKFAPLCTGFTDSQDDENEDEPEAVEAPEDAPETETPAADKALAEVGQKLIPAGNGVASNNSEVWYPSEKMDRLKDALGARDEAKEDFESKREDAKAAKDRLEVAELAVVAAARSLVGGEPEMPLYTSKPDNSESKPDKQPDNPPAKPDNPDDAWRSTPLMDIRKENGRRIIADKYIKALNENNPPITTMGELEAWREKKGNFWAKDIKGLGKKGREQIELACDAMLEQRQKNNK